jgi:hypothetical protein
LLPVDRAMGLTESLAAAMEDWRQPGKVTHEQPSLLRQRVFAIANGYPDGNDAAQLACDPMLLLACGRSPTDEQALASQPTLSRFENAARPRTLLAMAEALARTVPGEQQQQRTGRHRSDLRAAGVQCLQWILRRELLFAVVGHGQFRPRAGKISGGGVVSNCPGGRRYRRVALARRDVVSLRIVHG